MSLLLEVEEKRNKHYVFSEKISKNLVQGNWSKFLGKYRVNTEYKRSEFYSKKDIVGFINQKIIQGTITWENINDFLPRQLSFGKHKSVFIYNFDKEFNNNKVSILKSLKDKYKISSLEYNELARTIYYNSDGEEQDIAYCKIINDNGDKIIKLRLIMVKKVRYTIKNKSTGKPENKFEQSYFPIDIDFENKQFIIKAMVKDYINITEYKGHNLVKSIAKEVTKVLGLNVTLCKNTNQELLYKMSKKLLDDVIKEKGKAGLDELNSDIVYLAKETQKKISSKLNIDINNQALSKENITYEITSVIENIILPLILIDTKTIDGLISYIKFRDKTAVNAVLRSQRRKDTLLDSNSYLNLRKSLNESKYVEKIRVLWNESNISLYYDARDEECIEMHFYKELFEEDLNNELKRFNTFR